MNHYCSECDNVHSATRKEEAPWQWRCLAVPIPPGYGYVSKDYSPTPPYQLCRFVNPQGECQLFEAVRVLETIKETT